ncbi:CYT1 Cytochrome c1 [Burkholderiaceae bacterium]|jgi:ubiquinol-cytochrome c reductase cytochrome c1 subunit
MNYSFNMIGALKKGLVLISTSLLLGTAVAAGGDFPLDSAPDRLNNNASLQNGAKIFVNYCLGCHSAISLRYNRLRDIGLSDQQIKDNLILGDQKVGDLMTISMNPKDAKAWFGKVPPDLSVEARARGTDWLYTYFRTYYKDPDTPTGWNNLVYPNVGMPHVLWQLQGERAAKFEQQKDPHDPSKTTKVFKGFEQLSPGTMKPQEYDDNIADLVAFMSWMAEPTQLQRKRIGVVVLLFLAIFTLVAWRLNKAYWKDIR